MHPETKKITQKHALSNTDRKSKATTKPWFSRLLRHPARKRSGSILGQTHTHLLTYLLARDPHEDADDKLFQSMLRNPYSIPIVTRSSTWHYLLSATWRHDLPLSRWSHCISDCNFSVTAGLHLLRFTATKAQKLRNFALSTNVVT